jgi:hypothetical protein
VGLFLAGARRRMALELAEEELRVDLRPRIAHVLERACSWFGEDGGRLRVIVDGVMSRALLC